MPAPTLRGRSSLNFSSRPCVLARLVLSTALLSAVPSLAPSLARANEPASATAEVQPLGESLRGMARADYAAARILYEDGDYAGAYTKLEAAYVASKDSRLLWNMASCEKELRRYANVIILLERYLAEGKALITDDDRAATAQLVETVQGFVNELTLTVAPDGAEVLIDGIVMGTTPLERPLRVDMGKRKLGVQKAGFLPHQAEIDLAGGKSLLLDIKLAPELHEGTLRIISDPSAVISVDGRVVGTATWSGQLPSGSHTVHVSAVGKQPHKTEVVIKDDATNSLHVNLIEDTPIALGRPNDGVNPWWWVVGGVVAAGAGVGAYFIFKPADDPSQPELGTWGGFEL